MAQDEKRIDLQFGDIAISAQGMEDPVRTVKQVLRFVQRLVEETPEMTGAAFALDDDRIERLMSDLAASGALPDGDARVTPGLIVAAGASAPRAEPVADVPPERPASEPEGEEGAAPPDPVTEPDLTPVASEPVEDAPDPVTEAEEKSTEVRVEEPRPDIVDEEPDATPISAAPSEAAPAEEQAASPAADAEPRPLRTVEPEPQVVTNIFAPPPAADPEVERPRPSEPPSGGREIFDPAPRSANRSAKPQAGEPGSSSPFARPEPAEGGPPGRGPRWIEDPDEPAPEEGEADADATVVSRFDDLVARYRKPQPDPDPEPETRAGEAPAGADPTAAGLASASGATTVAELLAASAAWLTLVRQRKHFSRREVMEVFDTIPGDHPRDLETRIKGYGKLVRSGTLVLVDDGLFAMAEGERDRYRGLLG